METIQITAEQAEAALKNLNVLSESIRTMETLESKITNARSEARKIAQPILKAGRVQTTVLRAERKVIEAKIAVVEKPYREEADKKTEALREEAAKARETLAGVKQALYNAVNPKPRTA